MFTPDESDGPVPMPGDCVLVDDRRGCGHCSEFGPLFDRYSNLFPDSMIRVDAANYPPHMRKYVEASGGVVPTVMIVPSGRQGLANRGVSRALQRFIGKSAEKNHSASTFIGNIEILSRKVKDRSEREALLMLHDALENELSLNNAIRKIEASFTGASVLETAEDAISSDLEPSVALDVGLGPPPVVDRTDGLSSVLDLLSLDDEGEYDGVQLY